MEHYEKRRKIFIIANITLIAAPFLFLLIFAAISKSTKLLAISTQVAPPDKTSIIGLQWIVSMAQDFKLGTVILIITMGVALFLIAYCLIMGIYPPKTKQTQPENTENNTEDQDVCDKKCDDSVITTPAVTTEIPNEVQMSEKERPNKQEISIEEQVINLIIEYKTKNIIPYVYHWLTENGSLNGASQDTFIKFIKEQAGIQISSSYMSSTLHHVRDFMENSQCDPNDRHAYERLDLQLSSFIDANQPFKLLQSKQRNTE